MGYYVMFGTCVACEKPFAFNPHLVPSIRIEGNRQPLCANCVNQVNSLRIGKGLHPISVHPDAYQPSSEQDNADHQQQDDYQQEHR